MRCAAATILVLLLIVLCCDGFQSRTIVLVSSTFGIGGPSRPHSVVERSTTNTCHEHRSSTSLSSEPLARDSTHSSALKSPNVKKNGNSNRDDDDPNNDADTTSTDSWKSITTQLQLFQQMALPYYQESSHGRLLLLGMLGLTFLNSGVSVVFSFLGKDFWNALSAKDSAEFYFILQKYLAALLVGAPVVTFYRFQREQLAVHWREWYVMSRRELLYILCALVITSF